MEGFVLRKVLATIVLVLSGCDSDYFESHPVMEADCVTQAGRVNEDGEIEMDDPVPCDLSDETSESTSVETSEKT